MSSIVPDPTLTDEEKNRLILASAAVIVPSLLYNIFVKNKKPGDRIKDTLSAAALGIGAGILIVFLPRLIYGQKATTPIKDTALVTSIREKISSIGNKKNDKTKKIKIEEVEKEEE